MTQTCRKWHVSIKKHFQNFHSMSESQIPKKPSCNDKNQQDFTNSESRQSLATTSQVIVRCSLFGFF